MLYYLLFKKGLKYTPAVPASSLEEDPNPHNHDVEMDTLSVNPWVAVKEDADFRLFCRKCKITVFSKNSEKGPCRLHDLLGRQVNKQAFPFIAWEM